MSNIECKPTYHKLRIEVGEDPESYYVTGVNDKTLIRVGLWRFEERLNAEEFIAQYDSTEASHA